MSNTTTSTAESEIQRLNAELERAQHRVDEVLAAMNEAILVIGSSGEVDCISPAACDLIGAPAAQLRGRPAREVLEQCSGRQLRVARQDMSGDAAAGVVVLRRLEGDPGEEIQRLTDLFSELARLTHKINNPLTSLLGRAQLLQLQKNGDDQVTRAAEVIEESGRRVADYVREMAQCVSESRDTVLNSVRRRSDR